MSSDISLSTTSNLWRSHEIISSSGIVIFPAQSRVVDFRKEGMCESKSESDVQCARMPQLLSSATYSTKGSYTVDTRDHEDHTFSGIMFDIRARTSMPISYVEIHSLWVRGMLGEIRVYTTPNSHHRRHDEPERWTLVHHKTHPQSNQVVSPLHLDRPLVLKPGEGVGLYIHSSLPGDQAIVYNDQRSPVTHLDDFIQILPGRAHTSRHPFDQRGYWGYGAWRPRREFVGRVEYGVKFLLWNALNGKLFPQPFQAAVKAALGVKVEGKEQGSQRSILKHKSKRHKGKWHKGKAKRHKGKGLGLKREDMAGKTRARVNHLPPEIVKYIFNFCPWYWFEGVHLEEPVNSGPIRSFLGSLVRRASHLHSSAREVSAKKCLIS
ncbi:hypothetical protein AAMO2058_001373500 [Amorphochlora amoebiformis]